MLLLLLFLLELEVEVELRRFEESGEPLDEEFFLAAMMAAAWEELEVVLLSGVKMDGIKTE